MLDGAAPEIEQLIMAACTISFFGTRRVVVLPELDPAAYGDKDLDGGRHRLPDKIPLAGIEIVDRTVAVCQLAQFGFRCHGGAPFQKRIPYKCTHRGGKCQCRRQKKKRQMSFIASANVIY